MAAVELEHTAVVVVVVVPVVVAAAVVVVAAAHAVLRDGNDCAHFPCCPNVHCYSICPRTSFDVVVVDGQRRRSHWAFPHVAEEACWVAQYLWP